MLITGQFSGLFYFTGNIFSFMVVLSSLPTFYEVYKNKSTEGLQCLPYVVGLFSTMLWVYYAFVKGDAILVITIRFIGILIQILYLCVFIYYTPPERAGMETLKLITLAIAYGLIVLLTQLLTEAGRRKVIVGRVFLILSSLCVLVAPVSVLRQVIKSKSVECMPMLPVLFSTFNAIIWFFYGLLLRDFNIMIPNILGFTLSVIQIIFYFVYKNEERVIEPKITENREMAAVLSVTIEVAD